MSHGYRACNRMVYADITKLTFRTYQYIRLQQDKVPYSALVIVDLVFLTLYLAMLGFFICIFTLRLVFPWMIRLGDYATHDAQKLGRALAVAGIVCIWFCCVLWVIAFPLVAVIGGLIARQTS